MNISRMQKRKVFKRKSRNKLLSRREVMAMFNVMAKDLNNLMSKYRSQ